MMWDNGLSNKTQPLANSEMHNSHHFYRQRVQLTLSPMDHARRSISGSHGNSLQ
jgi:hypothetical protein